MTAAEIIQSADFDGVSLDLTPEGKLHYFGDVAMIKEWLPVLKENKVAIVQELNRVYRYSKVLSMLSSGRKYAVLVEDETADPVIATCAIRGIATFELAIPHHSYDGLILLELIEKHSTESHSQTFCGDNPAPTSNQPSQAHPTRRAA